MTDRPQIHNDPLYQLLRQGNVADFNKRKANGERGELSGTDFRAMDLRGMDAEGLDFTNSYFRSADLRGVDLREAKLEGASLFEAKISGAYFPKDISPEEIRLSLQFGTRLRRFTS